MAVTLADAWVRLRANPDQLGPDLQKGVKVPAEKAGEQADKSFDEGMKRSASKRKKKLPLPDDSESKKEGLRLGARIGSALANGLSTAGGPIARALSNVFGVLPPQAQVAIGGGIVAAVTLAAPLIGSAFVGAVLAGVGTGAVGIGIAAAFQDPRVKGAAKGFGDELKQQFAGIGQDFAADTVAAISAIRAAVARIGLREAFSPAAGYIRPLTEGLIGLVQNVLPALKRAIIAAKEPILALRDALPRLGTAVGSLLDVISDNAAAGATALRVLFDVLIVGLKIVEAQIAILAKSFEFFDSMPGLLKGPLGIWLNETKKSSESTVEWSANLDGLQAALNGTAVAANASTAAMETHDQMLRRLQGDTLSAERANIQLEESIDAATAAGKRNNDGIDASTSKGRANRNLLLQLADASLASRDAILQQTGSQEMANAATDRGRAAFLRAAQAMGVEKSEAIQLANQLFGIPREVKTTADFIPDNAGVSNWKKTLSGIPREIFTSARLRAIVNVEVRREQATEATGRRWGGVTEHARTGLLRDARIFAPPTRYAFAEPATGGEAFIPRFGNIARSLEILAHAASWYKMAIVPAKQVMSGEPSARRATRPRTPTQGGRGVAVSQRTSSVDMGPHVERLAKLLEKLIDAVSAVAPGVGREVNGIGTGLRNLGRARA